MTRPDEVVAWQLRYRFWDGAPWGQWHGYPTEAIRNAEADMFSAGNWLTESRDLTDVAALQSANARLAAVLALADEWEQRSSELMKQHHKQVGFECDFEDYGRSDELDYCIEMLRRAAAGEGDANQGDGE